MYRDSLRTNSKFNKEEILKYWFSYAFGSRPFPRMVLDSLLYKAIYKQLYEQGGSMPRIKADSPLNKSTKQKEDSAKKQSGGDSPTQQRRDFICDLLMDREYTDDVILKKVNNKFRNLNPLTVSRIGKMRSKINRGKLDNYPAPRTRLEQVTE